MTRRAVVSVTPEKLCEALDFPEQTDVIAVAWDLATNCIVLQIRHPDLPDMAPGGHALRMTRKVTWV